MLLIHASSDSLARYSRYLAEILRLEGYADFVEADQADLDAAGLARHDLVILPRLAPSHTQAELLQQYVQGGGCLIACAPEMHLARRLGLAPRHTATVGGYLRVENRHAAMQGLWPAPVQVLAPAVAWTPAADADLSVLAHVTPQRGGGDAIPGVVHVRLGQGQAIAFAYDLPHAVARLRQGNPDNAEYSFAGLDGIYRPSELFVGQMDVEQMRVPQADVHTALLARAVETLAPRPRLWYYPHAGQRSTVVMTSDDDWSTVEQFQALLAGLRARQGRCTFFVVPGTHLTRALMDEWEAEGHTFSVHPALESDTVRMGNVAEPQRVQVAAMLRKNVARHRQQFGRSVRTIRQHAVRWLGYVDAARDLVDLGVEMESNYISVHPFSLGYMAGSGRPLPFVDIDGHLIRCYQQPSLWTEEVLIHPEFVFSFKWTVERALAETGEIIRQAAQDFYTPITFNSHPVSFATYSSPLIEGCWDAAMAQGMPIVSADDWLSWTQVRRSAQIDADARGFTVYAPQPLPAVTVLSPRPVDSAAGGQVSQQVLWGRPTTAVTLTNLAAGERRTVRFAATM